MSIVQQTSTSGGNQRHCGVARDIEAPGLDCDLVHRHADATQALDGIVGAASVGDDPVIGVGGRIRPALGMRRLVQRDRIDGDFHRPPCSPRHTGAAAFADCDEAAAQVGTLELVMAVEEQDVGDPPRDLSDPERIGRLRAAIALNFAQ